VMPRPVQHTLEWGQMYKPALPTYEDLPSDEVMLALIAAKDQSAIAVIYDRYASAMMGLSRRMGFDKAAQEDCLQEIFMRIWEKASSFDQSRATARSWILAVGHHYCVDRVRRDAVRPKAVLQDEEEETAFDVASNGLDEYHILDRIRIKKAMMRLSDVEQSVVEALHFMGMTYTEAAKHLNIPLGTFKLRVSEAMRKLKGVLHEA
jgi:RNA polymerase sigma-70 factor, ECF subfamily